MPVKPSTQILSVAEAADKLGVIPRRVRALIAARRLPAARLGERAWAIRAEDLERVRVRKPGRPAQK